MIGYEMLLLRKTLTPDFTSSSSSVVSVYFRFLVPFLMIGFAGLELFWPNLTTSVIYSSFVSSASTYGFSYFSRISGYSY